MLRRRHDHDPVRAGALLRIASDLLVPHGELGALDRFQLIEWLATLRIRPVPAPHAHGSFWVEDACPGPEPRDEVTVLRRDGADWIVGYWERGSFDVRHRFSSEGDACKWMLHDLVSHHAVSMGTTTKGPHVRDEYRASILEALDEVAALVRRGR